MHHTTRDGSQKNKVVGWLLSTEGLALPQLRRKAANASSLSRAVLETLEERRMLIATVGIEAIDAVAAEATSATGTFRLTRDDTDGDLTVKIVITGTAINGTDYKTVAEEVDFADGKSTADITITPTDDSSYEGAETVIVTLDEDMAYEIDSGADTDTVSITDNEKPTVKLTASDKTADEADSDETGTFTISRNGPTDGALSVKVAITGTATNGTDYDTIATSVSIPDGEESIEVDVVTKSDSTLEGKETVILTLASDSGYSIDGTDKTGTVTIADDEKPTVKIIATDGKGLEGSTTDTGKFTISRDGSGTAIAEALTVKYTVSGSATDGTDYDTISTSAIILAGKSSVDVSIKTKNDSSVELTESATVTLATDSAYSIDGSKKAASINITDDDKPTVTLTASDATAAEIGKNNTGKFTISRTGATTESLTVPIVITGTGSKGTDYKAIATSVVIPVGKSTKVVEVKPIDDADLEGPETVIATLGTSSALIAGSGKTGTVTITEDEVPEISIVATDATATEPTTDKGTYTVTRTGPTTSALTVFFVITGTTTNGTDMTEIAESVEIPAGKASATVSVAPTDDITLEGTETVILTIDDKSSYNVDTDADADTVKLKDNEKPTVQVAASDASGAEAGSATGKFTFTRDGSTLEDLIVSYAVTGTATNGTDYTKIGTSVTIPAGSLTKTVTITPADDSALEGSETVIATLASAATYTVHSTNKAGTVTITDNEKPTVKIVGTDVKATEPTIDKGTLTVGRDGSGNAIAEALEVLYTVSGTATNGTDYTELTETVTIPAGKSSATISIAPTDDSTLEGRETVIVTLASDTAYSIDTNNKKVTTDLFDDEKPTVSIEASDDEATENVSDDTGEFTFSRTGPTQDELEIAYMIGGTLTTGTDTDEILTGKVTIPAGSSETTITITPENDSKIETEETLVLTLKAGNYTIHSTNKTGSVTMVDDEKPTVSVVATDATSKENSADSMTFVITRDGATINSLEVDISSTSSTAAAGDLAAALPSSVTIPAGKSFVTLTVATKNDTDYEGTETLELRIDAGDAYQIDGDAGAADGTITDDEAPTVSITANDASASEVGNSTGQFTISRSGPTTDAVVVKLGIGGSALNKRDYTAISKTVTIPAGSASKTITITPATDTVVEGTETVVLAMATNAAYKIDSGSKSATVSIADAQKPEISVEAQDTPLLEEGETTAKFRIWRTGQNTGQSLAIKFGITGTADVDDDYTIKDEDGNDVTDTITIAPGEAYVDVYVTAVDDAEDTDDADETVIITLDTDSAYDIDGGNDSATIEITDNDA